jgi:predicted glycoside hydrolase/deacetylase ChbG (UPF0249 family)
VGKTRTHGRSTRVIPLEEAVDRFAESSAISAVRLYRYWVSQGNSRDEAIRKAVKQATGMMASSGASLEKMVYLLRELASASKALAEAAEQASKEAK